jgi:hypothetical protein
LGWIGGETTRERVERARGEGGEGGARRMRRGAARRGMAAPPDGYAEGGSLKRAAIVRSDTENA